MPVKKQKKVTIGKDKVGTYKTTNITRRSGKKIVKKKNVLTPESGKQYTYKSSKSAKTNKKGQKVEKYKDGLKLKGKPLKMYMLKFKKVDDKQVKKRGVTTDKTRMNKRKSVVKNKQMRFLRDQKY